MSDDDNDAALASQQELEEQQMNIYARLSEIQQTLNAPKGQINKFGGYRYRSCEDILAAVKPLLNGLVITESDEITVVGDRYYVKATATLTDGTTHVSVTAYAREPASKKGADESQITGAASSYARKYALNGLLAIDDTKDADATNDHGKKGVIKPTDGAADGLTQEEKDTAERVAQAIHDLFHEGDEFGAYGEYVAVEDQQMRIAVWALLPDSKIRSALKRMAAQEKEAEHA